MENRFFGFDAEEIQPAAPKTEILEDQLKSVFGANGFSTSMAFALTLEEAF